MKLRYFVDAALGYYTSYLAMHAKYSLFIPKTKQEKVQIEKCCKRLELFRTKVEVTYLYLEVAEANKKEQSLASYNLRIYNVIDYLKEEVPKGIDSINIPGPSLFKLLLTNLGWLQADFSFNPFLDPFLLDPSLFNLLLDPVSQGSTDKTPIAVFYSL